MPLDLDQRRDRLRLRMGELESWRIRARKAVAGWTFDGAPLDVGALWPAREGVHAFASRAVVPAEWPLEETRLCLDLGGESLVTLTYLDAQESFGLDPYHQEFPLLARSFSIAAESVARAPFGQPVAAPALRRAEIAWIDVEVEALYRLIGQIVDAAATLKADEVTPHLLEAGEAALRALVWPSHTPDYVARIAPTSRSQSIWRQPPVAVDPPGLDDAERASLAAARAALVERLAELKRRYPPRGNIALTGHAHIDLAWLWPYDETRRKLRRTFHTALGLMARAPDFRFNQSTAHYYAQIEEDDPALFAAIVARVKEGRWEPIGAMWVEPDTNMPTGESLVRQLLYGQLYFERAFGMRPRVCWLPDCFGFSPALPQLLRQAGVDSFLTIKLTWSETNRFPHDLFWWEGLDGSRVLAHLFDNPLSGYNGDVRATATGPTWANFRQKTQAEETLLAVGYGDGGGGVTPEMIARETDLRDFPALPQARWSRVDDFFARAHEAAREKALPRWSGEMYLELHRATLTSQAAVKQKHRRAERALIVAETLASLAHLLGGEAPASLEPAWRLVLKNEFHDILPGSSIREVYEDAARELDGVLQVAAVEQHTALIALAAIAPRGEIDDALAIVNPSFDPRALELPGEDFVSTAETIPPLAVRIVSRKTLIAAPGLSVNGRTLENAQLRVSLGEDGALTSLVHKASGCEAIEGRGNQLWVYPQDKPRNWDAWDVEEDYEASGEEIVAERIEIAADGPHYASLRVHRRWRHSRIVQEIGLSAAGRRVDIRSYVDWRDRRALLRSLTPARVRARVATAECAFGVVERPTHRNTSWEAAMFEWAAHRFVDLSEPGFGLALLNDSKYGHSVRDNVLGISLVRSPVYPDPLADEGEHGFTYALMPHTGAWHEAGVRAEADALNQPLLVLSARGLAEGVLQPLSLGGLPVALAGLKSAEDGDGLVLRVYEPHGARGEVSLTLPAGWRAAGVVDLLERAMETPAEIGPFEVRSWRLKPR